MFLIVMLLVSLVAGCGGEELVTETATLVFVKAPGDVTAPVGSKVTLDAMAKSNVGEQILYVWEKLVNDEKTQDVSQTATLELNLASTGACSGPTYDAYRVIASAGALNVEKSFTVSTLCQADASLQ
ncbi:hypothetical protein EHM76_06070, partial [bacterium]